MSKRRKETRSSSPSSPRPPLPPRPARGTFSFEGLAAGFHQAEASSSTPLHSTSTMDPEFAGFTRGITAQDVEGSQGAFSFEGPAAGFHEAQASSSTRLHSSPTMNLESAGFARGIAAQDVEESQETFRFGRSAAAVHEAYLRPRVYPWKTTDPDFAALTHGLFVQDFEGFEESSSSDESVSDPLGAQASSPAPSHHSSTMDPESTALASDISEEDVKASQKRNKGKQPMRDMSDADESDTDTEDWDWDFSDQDQTRSNPDIEGKKWDDIEGEMTHSSQSQHPEHQDRLARQMARSLAGQAIANPRARHHFRRRELRDDVLMQLPSRARTARGSSEAGPSSDTTATECTCVVCADSANEADLIEVPCMHRYCKDCLVRLVEVALTDEARFPPRCCTMSMPRSFLAAHVGADLVRKYEEKATERADTARTYCSNKACSSYILPSNVEGSVGSCSICGTETCTVCKQGGHEGGCQPEEDGFLAAAAEEWGWKRCQCGHLIERNRGCMHVTCRCGRELCYGCGKKWGTCVCAFTARLARPQITRRTSGPDQQWRFFEPRPVDDVVWLETRGIGCDHPRQWDRVEWGSLQCPLCHHLMPQFILQCPLCATRACERCKWEMDHPSDL